MFSIQCYVFGVRDDTHNAWNRIYTVPPIRSCIAFIREWNEKGFYVFLKLDILKVFHMQESTLHYYSLVCNCKTQIVTIFDSFLTVLFTCHNFIDATCSTYKMWHNLPNTFHFILPKPFSIGSYGKRARLNTLNLIKMNAAALN